MVRQVIIVNQVKGALSLEGDLAEVGVYRGWSAKHIHTIAPHKILHLYDTFKGIVKADISIDVHNDGNFSDVSFEDVKKFMGESENIKYHVGIFPDTFTEHDRKFCFVYSDTDTYFGSKATLDIFATRMVSGGKIMFDDYGWRGCPGVKKAVEEFLASNSIKYTEIDGTQFIITFK